MMVERRANKIIVRLRRKFRLFYGYCRFLSRYRKMSNLMFRAIKILGRYGMTSKRMEQRLHAYVDLMQKYNCAPSWPITGVVLQRYPKLMRELSARGAELSIHGYLHTDYAQLSGEEQSGDIERAIRIFQQSGCPPTGFRCPYLGGNGDTLRALAKQGLCWDGSSTVLWDWPSRQGQRAGWTAYRKMLAQYRPKEVATHVALPYFNHDIVQIPVSLPDDDMLLDRLGITRQKELADIWSDVLKRAHRLGELFALQLHPERISLCGEVLDTLLREARGLTPPVWIAQLGEIDRWWRERRAAKLEISRLDSARYEVSLSGTERGTVLVKGAKVDCPTEEFFGRYVIAKAKCFALHSHVTPLVGMSPSTSKEYADFCRTEGFEVQMGCQENACGVYLDADGQLKEESKRQILNMIEHAPGPLVRLWRWPQGAQSALSVTGDIDAMTWFDFVRRAFQG